MKIKLYHSIKFQMSCFIVLMTTTILVGFGYYSYHLTKKHMTDDLMHFSEITAKRLSKYLVLPLWTMNKKQIEESIVAEMMDKRIYGIVVKTGSDQNIIFMSKKRDAQWKIVNNLEELKGNYIKKSYNLEKDSKNIGSVEVYLTSKFMNEALDHSTFLIVIQVAVLDVMIFVVLFLLINGIVINNINELAKVTEKISMGHFEDLMHFKLNNEFGILVEAIERMRVTVDMAMKKLKK